MLHYLYAPWRSWYLKKKNGTHTVNECPFCRAARADRDQLEQVLVLARTEHSIVMLNKYPYNAGHLLVLPMRHEASLSSLSLVERTDLFESASRAMDILKDTLCCDGLNLGMNVGKTAGGSIPDHLHLHIVPRFAGDTNFLMTTDHTKTVSFDIGDMYRQLAKAFDSF